MKARASWLLAATLALPAHAATLVANDFEPGAPTVGPAPIADSDFSDGPEAIVPGGSLSGHWLELALHLYARLEIATLGFAGPGPWSGGTLIVSLDTGPHQLAYVTGTTDAGDPFTWGYASTWQTVCPNFQVCAAVIVDDLPAPPLVSASRPR